MISLSMAIKAGGLMMALTKQFKIISLTGAPILTIDGVTTVERNSQWSEYVYEVTTPTQSHRITIPKKQTVIIETKIL